MTAEFLERADDRISVITDPRASDGLDRLAAEPIDCIVSDYDMPDMDGIEFLETLREDDPALPFILYTGKGTEEVASEAISKGITDYLQMETGSGHYELLANRIGQAVERHRADRPMSAIAEWYEASEHP